MGLFLSCLSIVLAYFSPTELVPALAPYHLQLIILLSGLVVSFATVSNYPGHGLQSPQYLLILGFWGAIVASHAARFRFRWALDGFQEFGTLVAIYFVVALNTSSLRRTKILAGIMISCAVVIGSQAILAYHTGYLGRELLLIAPDDPAVIFGNRVRGYGFLQDPNDFCQFLLVSIALLGMFWKKSSPISNLVRLGPPAVIMLYAAYLTFSRGGLLGLGAVLFFAFYRKGRRAVALSVSWLATGFLYSLHYTGNREISLESGRLMAWGAGISAIVHNPVFGVGFSRYEDINDLTAHNSFVLCFAETGLFGYFFWMALLLTTFIGISAVTNLEVKTPEDEAFAGAVFSIRAALGAFIVTGWFLSRTYTPTLYILLALASSLIFMRGYALPREKFHLGTWGPRTVALEILSIILVYVAIKVRVL